MSRYKLKPSQTGQANITAIVEPGYVRGMATAQSPYALPEGMMPYLQNIRLDDSVVAARPGSVLICAMIGSGGFRGIFEGFLDGVPYIWIALASAGKTVIWQSSNAGVTFTDITPTTGPFGDTRLTDTGNPVAFAIVTDRGALGATMHDLLVIQSGDSADQMRVFGKAADSSTAFAPGTQGMAVSYQPTQPQSAYVSIGGEHQVGLSGTTVTPSSINFNGFYSAPIILIAENASATAGETVTIAFSSPLDLSNSQQFIMEALIDILGDQVAGQIVNPASPYDYSISLSDGTHTQLVWDPAGASTPLSFFDDAGPLQSDPVNGVYYFVAPTSQMTNLTLNNITKVIITLVNKHLPGGSVGSCGMSIQAILAGGNIQFGASFAVGFGSSDARAIGPTTDITVVKWTFDPQGFAATNPPSNEDIFWSYSLFMTAQPALEILAGVDLLQIYATLTGQNAPFLVEVVKLNHWTGTVWTGLASFPIIVSTIAEQDFLHPDPQASAMIAPIGMALEGANGRLWLGSGPTLYISTFNSPFLFYDAVVTNPATGQLDPNSGSTFIFAGETVQRIIAVGAVAGPTEALGIPPTSIATINLLTDQNLYQIAGFAATSFQQVPYGPHGTLSPYSAAIYENKMYWLDQRGQVRIFQWYNSKAISLELVDDQTMGIPGSRLQWVWGCCLNGRYYLSYSTPSETTNVQILVWSDVRDMWETIDVPGGYTSEGMIAYYDSANNALRLLCADAGNALVEHARPGSTAGDLGSAGVEFVLEAEYIHGPTFTEWAIIRDTGVMCDGVFAGTLTTSKLGIGLPTPYLEPLSNADPNPAIGTISLDFGVEDGFTVTQAWDLGTDQTNAEAQTGMQAPAVQLTISGTVPGMWKLYALFAKLTLKENMAQRP